MDEGMKIGLPVDGSSPLFVTNGARLINRQLQRKELNIEKVAQDFESFLIFTVLKELEKTTHMGKKGYAEQTYMSIVYEKMGDYLSQKGLGIKEMLVRYMGDRNIKVLKETGDNTVSKKGGTP